MQLQGPTELTMAESDGWNITKAEWDSLAPKFQNKWFIYCAMMFKMLFIVALCAAWYFIKMPISTDFLLWIALVVFLIAVGGWAWKRRTDSRWTQFHPIVWESHGCACPWCKTRVDMTPCERHGFSANEQPQLLAYWEALATEDTAASARSSVELVRLAESLRPAASIGSRLWRGAIGPYRRVSMHIVTVSNDPNATTMMRVRASVTSWLLLVVLLVVYCAPIAVAVYAIFGRSILLSMLSGCWWMFPVMLVPGLLGPMARPGRVRCEKCEQQCADLKPKLCLECGSDLTKPGAVTRVDRAANERRRELLILLIIPPMILIVAAREFGLAKQLPLSTQLWWSSWTGPSYGFFQSLNVATLSPAEAASAAELLIAQAAPDGSRRVSDYDFLVKALASGKVPESTREAAARAIVLAELEVSTEDGVTTATVSPEFGALILGPDATPRFVFGGVSVDGAAWSTSSELSLMNHDLDSFYRALKPAERPLPLLPESQLRYETTLTLTPGTHEIRARGWIVLWGEAWKRFVPTFDVDGKLISSPTMSGVYEIQLHETVTIQ